MNKIKEISCIRQFQNGKPRMLLPVFDAYSGWLKAQAVRAFKRNPEVQFDDIHQAVILAFIEACKKFDAVRGARISTFAAFVIQDRLTFELMNKRDVKSPNSVGCKYLWHNLAREVRNRGLDLSALTSEHIEHLSYDLNVSEQDIELMARYLSNPIISLDEPSLKGDSDTTHKRMPVVEPDAIRIISDNESTKLIFQAVQNLPERERLIIELMHPADGKEPITLEVMSQMLGVSGERIRQIKEKAYSRIKSDLKKQKISKISDMMEAR